MLTRVASLAALVFILAVSSASAQGPCGASGTQPDCVASPNVELVNRVRTDGTGVGAKIIGDKMYVTSTHRLGIYDVSAENAENPKDIGGITLDVQFENEEVPTNGKVLGISSDTFCIYGDPNHLTDSGSGCFAFYDVSDPANVHLIKVLPQGDHTQGCALDCNWFYGSSGTIIDATNAKDPKLAGNWIEAMRDAGFDPAPTGCHHVREIKPGIMLGSCNPVITLFSIRAQDGATPTKPVILATGDAPRFVHSSRWPRMGADKFMLVGGENNATPRCETNASTFDTWGTDEVRDGNGDFKKGGQFHVIDSVMPINGTYADGHSPYNVLGCSVHWFEEHPSFKNGGLVALAEYENGTRFEQVGPDGKMKEQGYFLPATGSTSAPHWNPNAPNIVYTIDYTRGFDVLRWKGDLYVPDSNGDVVHDPTKVPGTNGKIPANAYKTAPNCASTSGFKSVGVKPKGKGLAFAASRRRSSKFTVELFQENKGGKVGERRVLFFKNKSKGFTWKGKAKGIADGYYFARYIMKYKGGKDTRRVTLVRANGKWTAIHDFFQANDCGAFSKYTLGRPVFGGTKNAPLAIKYRLRTAAKNVALQAIVDGKEIKRFEGTGTEAKKLFSFSLPADAVPAGKEVEIVLTAQFSDTPVQQSLYARRL